MALRDDLALIKAFARDRKGVTAVLFSIALVPIIGTLAVATDYSKAMKQKSTLQQIVDSTATALARDTDALLLTPAQLNARALAYASSVSGSMPVDNLGLTVTINADSVHIDATGKVKLTFAQILGTDSLVVNVGVTVERAKTKNLEVALALDNTGSMSGSKITQLKAAVKALVDYMSDKTKNPGNTKIALVPFTNYVRTDPAWMLSSYLAGTPSKKWVGCVTDRNQPYDASDDSPLGGSAKLYPFSKQQWVWSGKGWALQDVEVNCGSLAAITPMTSDLTKIKAAADLMIASGPTNVPIGVAWAWHALSNGVPLNQGSPPDTKDLMRVMIVLTDGDNTSNRWGGNSGGAIDKRLTAVCTNVKASGIIVYTVRVIDGNAAVLQSCATSTSHYFNVTNASQLTPVFEQIASSLSKLRISK